MHQKLTLLLLKQNVLKPSRSHLSCRDCPDEYPLETHAGMADKGQGTGLQMLQCSSFALPALRSDGHHAANRRKRKLIKPFDKH